MNAMERVPLGNPSEKPYSEEELKELVGKQLKIKEEAQELINKMEADEFNRGKFPAINKVIADGKKRIMAADAEIARIKEIQKKRLSSQQSEKLRRAA